MKPASEGADVKHDVDAEHDSDPRLSASKPWRECTTHIHSPDYQAMGDCRVCGHAMNAPWHVYGPKEMRDV